MSIDASVSVAGSRERNDYDDMLERLDLAIDEAARKIDEGRVRDVEKEKVRIKWIRALAYVVDIRRRVTNDRDLDELAEEVDELKALKEVA